MHLDVALLLVWLSLGALLAPLLAPRLGVPEAVLQIGYGILLAGFAIVQPHGDAASSLHLLAELGFILLMFGAGLEIDFDAIERGGRTQVLRGLGVAVGVIAVSAVLALGLGLGPFYVIVLSATSVGLGVVVLRETGLASAPVGQAVLLVGSLGEFGTLVLMTVYDVHHEVGFGMPMLVELSKLMALVAASVVFLRFLKAWTWWHPGLFRRVFSEHDPSELGVRAAVAACLVFVMLAVALHVESILGAFLAGAVSRQVFRDVEVLESKMSALSSGFFIPIFFIAVGLDFDVSLLSWQGLAAASGLGLLLMIARILPALALSAGVGLRLRESLGVAMLLGAPLTLLVAIARLGQDIGVLGASEASSIVLLAILLSVGLPIGFRMLLARRTVP
jgi:Kef-type K+ transport system membrane component KefB